MLILLAGLAMAGMPDGLRRDGAAVFGCSSSDALDEAKQIWPGDLAQDVGQGVQQLQSLGLDPERPFWLVLDQVNGRLLPTQLWFHVPDGVELPTALLRMMPGSPRVERDGQRVSVWIGRAGTGPAQPISAMIDGVADPDGCVLGAAGGAGAMAPVDMVLSSNMKGHGSVVLDLSGGADGVDVLGQSLGMPVGAGAWLVQVARKPADPPREAWGRSQQLPATAVRFNAELPIEPLLGLVFSSDDEVPKRLRKIQIEPGAELAVPAGSKDGARALAAVLPIHKPRTVWWWPGRIAAGARKQGVEVQRLPKRIFGIEQEDGSTLWIAARKRRLLVGTDRDLVVDLKAGEGQPWLPVAAEPHKPGMVFRAAMNGRPINGIASVRDDALVAVYWLEADVPTTP